MMTLDESTLIAYVDGELDLQTAREVEAALARDAALSEHVEHLRALAALTRVAYNDVLHDPVPERLKDAAQGKTLEHFESAPQHAQTQAGVETGTETGDNVVRLNPKARGGFARALPHGFAAAAAVAGLVLGLGGGYTFSEQTNEKAMQLAALTLQQDQGAMDDALNRALEVNISGDPLTWQNPDSGRKASFTPVRTYQDQNGRFCREYRKDVSNGERTESTFGLACRTGQGEWKTRYLILEDGLGQNL